MGNAKAKTKTQYLIGETGISAWDYTLLNVWDATCPARRSCRRRHVAGPTRDPGQEAHRVRVPSVLSRVRPMRVSLAESHPANHRRVALAGVCPPGRGKGTRSTGWLVSPVRASFSCSCLITRSGSRLAHFARSGSACRSFEPCSCLITRSGSRLAHFCPVGLHFDRASRAPASSPVRARGSRTLPGVGLRMSLVRAVHAPVPYHPFGLAARALLSGRAPCPCPCRSFELMF